MGLSASQVRYLSLTARKSDLEYQSQIIGNARIALANKSADANKAYTEGMSNKIIRIADGYVEGTGKKLWTELTFENALSSGYQIMGGWGESLVPSPYIEHTAGTELSQEEYDALPESVKSKFAACNYDLTLSSEHPQIALALEGDTLTPEEYAVLFPGHKERCTLNADGNYTVNSEIVFNNTTSPITSDILRLLQSKGLIVEPDENGEGGEYKARTETEYKATGFVRYVNPDYNGMDIQSLLVSGRAQVVTNEFFNFMCEHGYGTGRYYNIVNGEREETTYKELVENFQNIKHGIKTVVDWRADESNMFREEMYTEDDAQVLAEFEAATSEIQAQDKKLELQLKRIETEHKAIETEMESIKKVIDKNIESSYKTFG